MIRRVHQIAVSLFLEETGSLGITNRQWGILFVLKHRPEIDHRDPHRNTTSRAHSRSS